MTLGNPNGRPIHGHAHTGRISAEWRAWEAMKTRCYNTKIREYKDYGGRGIKVCPEWIGSFQAFFDYIGPKPSPAHTVERINNDGNYEPGNVRWATRKEQSANQRDRSTSHFVEWGGEKITITKLAKRLGMNYNTLYARIQKGWPIERACTPVSR